MARGPQISYRLAKGDDLQEVYTPAAKVALEFQGYHLVSDDDEGAPKASTRKRTTRKSRPSPTPAPQPAE